MSLALHGLHLTSGKDNMRIMGVYHGKSDTSRTGAMRLCEMVSARFVANE